jgi:hypothetical protein
LGNFLNYYDVLQLLLKASSPSSSSCASSIRE